MRATRSATSTSYRCWSPCASRSYACCARRARRPKLGTIARGGQQVATAADVIKDPFVLEFLDLRETSGAHERDLEQAIITRLEDFLLEMGKGFCFVGRQKRITLEGDHFYVDLVFYNRLLRCFVLVDLKLGKLTHQDLGRMQMYVNFFDRFQRAEHEAPTRREGGGDLLDGGRHWGRGIVRRGLHLL